MTVKLPAAVGLPDSTPFVLIDMPGGNPAADQTYGELPPLIARGVEGYATPTSPIGIDGAESVRTGIVLPIRTEPPP